MFQFYTLCVPKHALSFVMVGTVVLTAEQVKLLQEESEIRSRVQNIQKDVQAALNALSGLAKAVSTYDNKYIIIPQYPEK